MISDAFHKATLASLVAGYENTAQHNDYLHRFLTETTWLHPILSKHRSYIEENRLGFGDAAFHSMWDRILLAAHERFSRFTALEVGVYKGQVISLWSLLKKINTYNAHIYALTPLEGNPTYNMFFIRWLRQKFDRAFRENLRNGNFYAKSDYEAIIRSLYKHFDLDFASITLLRGYSTDKSILYSIRNITFNIVYIDGDHTYSGALHDFHTFGPLVAKGGWLIADDAGCDLPGATFWKGHDAVSRAAEVIPGLGFRNILNIGHNRVYERIS